MFHTLDERPVSIAGRPAHCHRWQVRTRLTRWPAQLNSSSAGLEQRQRRDAGQVGTADKNNEITAVPELLGSMDIRGANITIDAMGCHARFAQCKLEMHPTKTKIVCCKDGSRKGLVPTLAQNALGKRKSGQL